VNIQAPLPTDIFRAIDQLTVGEYRSFAGHLVGVDDPRPSVSAEALLNVGMRDAIIARFAKRFESFEPRAALSIWTKWYINTFLPPMLLADLVLVRRLPVALDRITFIISDDARVAAVKINGSDEDANTADPFERFESLLFDHFEPLIEMRSARSDVARRVLWSNVGNTFEAMLRKVEIVSGSSERLEQAQRLLSEPFW
jgi:ferric iron reductase protein FhuF